MGAKILDWIALNKAFVAGVSIGIIAGCALRSLGAYLTK